MIIKESFELIKDMPNVFHYSENQLKGVTIESDLLDLIRLIKLLESRVKHFTSEKVFDLIYDDSKVKKNIRIVKAEKYLLPVSYNIPTDEIIINILPFGISEISRLDSKVAYSLVAYGICFKSLVTKKLKITEKYASPYINYLMTVLIRIFGKEFGLLGAYSGEIPKLKFLLSTYILTSFFGIKQTEAYKISSSFARFNYNNIEQNLRKYDFNSITDLILSLSELKVMPGISKYNFTAKILKFLSVNFLPALEDISRFTCTILASDISGNNMIPAFIYSYNKNEYDKILEMTKVIF
jgi:hypothetical protein